MLLLMSPEVGDLFPGGIMNQNEQVVEVVPDTIPGPSNVLPDSQYKGGEDTDPESGYDCQSPSIASLRGVSWLHKPVPRPMRKRVDILFYY